MPDEVGPESLSTKGIPAVRRGLDKRAVDRVMSEAASRWARLKAEHDELLAELEATGGLEYFKADLAALGAEVGLMLTDAREAADGIRARAATDAEHRFDQASEHAGRVEAEADQVAFTIRRQAWEEGTRLLGQVQETVRAMIEQADADVLIIRAEAEQEAHRRVAAARREGSDIVRNARFEAERLVTEAKALASDLTSSAQQEAEAAQQRTRALEGRRRKLLEQMDEERHGASDAGIRVITPPDEPRPSRQGRGSGVDELADHLAAEVEEMQGEARRSAMEQRTVPSFPEADGTDEEPEPEAIAQEEDPAADESEEPVVAAVSDPEPEAAEEPEPEAEPEAAEPESEALAGQADDKVSGLFAALRGEDATDAAEPTEPAEPAEEPEPAAGADPIEIRDRHLLAVQNAGLRAVKQTIVEVQNMALDALRVDGEWVPDEEMLADQFGAATDTMVEDAAGAGAAAAAEMTGEVPPAPVISTRSAELTGFMIDDLIAKVRRSLEESGSAGPRELSAAVSRTFRGWRGEDAERWVAAIASSAYHDSLLAGLGSLGVEAVAGVRHGRACDTCPAATGATWSPAGPPPDGTSLPPADVGCHCTVAPSS